jgi:cell division protein ZapA (FtsZ GTPase activity inhibitor)
MKKLLSLLGAIGLVATSSATVVSCDNGDKDSSNAGDFSTDLSKVAGDTTALEGVIKTQFEDTDKIADATSLCSLIQLTMQITLKILMTTGKGDVTMPGNITDKIKVMKNQSHFMLTLKPQKKVNYGTTVLKGTITNEKAAPVEKTDLSKIATKDLGTIADTSAATIVAAMNTVNEGLNLTEADVEITLNEDSKGATVKATDASENFTGSVDVTFTVGDVPATKTDLADAVKVTVLGEITDTNAATIVAAINAANEGLKLTEADVEITPNEDNKGATVKATDASENFTGSVDVTFTVTEA